MAMADDLPFRSQAGAASRMRMPEGELAPYRDTHQGAAPAGLFPTEGELPIRSASGRGYVPGFSPSSEGPDLPPPGTGNEGRARRGNGY
jgi:hypothetical protein